MIHYDMPFYDYGKRKNGILSHWRFFNYFIKSAYDHAFMLPKMENTNY